MGFQSSSNSKTSEWLSLTKPASEHKRIPIKTTLPNYTKSKQATVRKMTIQEVITRRNIGACSVIVCLWAIYGDFCDILVSEGFEELLHTIIDDGLVAFRIGNLLDFSRHDVYLQLGCLR